MNRQILDTSIVRQRMLAKKPNRFDIILKAVFVYIILLLIILWIVVSFTILGKVNGTSMENTLRDGDYLLLLKTHKNIKVGDIVILPLPSQETDIVKRVIAVGGESIRFVLNSDSASDGDQNNDTIDLEKKRDGHWVKVDESKYIKESMQRSFFYHRIPFGYYDGQGNFVNSNGEVGKQGDETFDIPNGKCFVMGDNRNNSRDSRQEGLFDTTSIEGKVYAHLKRDSFEEWLFKLVYGEL